ncbi:MAG: hypothetical protein J2P25_10720 [Nocardiopsaceae bacterium]|nr:hypothetical protein [Nocardiopsaceae bacterium]
MRQVMYRAVITLDPAKPGSAPSLRGHGRHRHHGPLPVPHPRSTAQTGPGALASAAVPATGTGASGTRASATGEYLNHTHELVLRTESPEKPGSYRTFATELSWDDEMPLHPGDRHVVTLTVTDDDAPRFLNAGQRFTLWSGSEVGHGMISRKVFTQYGPC